MVDVYEEYRRRSLEKIFRHSADFQRIFGRNLLMYVCNTKSGAVWIDWPRLFEDIGIPLHTPSRELMRQKYGDKAVELIGKLIA